MGDVVKQSRRWLGALAFSFALAASGACSRSDSAASPAATSLTVIKVAGSTAVLPLVTAVANRYMGGHAGVVVQVEGGGSRQGLARVAEGGVSIGTSDVLAAPGSNLEDHRIAVVGFAAMANRGPFNDSIRSLTMAQLRGIFTGTIHDWAEVGGTSQPIVLINRAKNSGTRAAVGAIVLGGDGFAPGAEEQDSSALVQTSLRERVGSVSYLALSYKHEALRTFALDGVEPTPQNIETGAYPLWSYEHMYTAGTQSDAVRAFIEYFVSPEVQTSVVPSAGFIPIGAMQTWRDG